MAEVELGMELADVAVNPPVEPQLDDEQQSKVSRENYERSVARNLLSSSGDSDLLPSSISLQVKSGAQLSSCVIRTVVGSDSMASDRYPVAAAHRISLFAVFPDMHMRVWCVTAHAAASLTAHITCMQGTTNRDTTPTAMQSHAASLPGSSPCFLEYSAISCPQTQA